MDGLGSLAFGDAFGGLLDLDVLLVAEETSVVDDLEALPVAARLAHIRLLDLTLDHIHLLDVLALVTLEASFLHLWDDV